MSRISMMRSIWYSNLYMLDSKLNNSATWIFHLIFEYAIGAFGLCTLQGSTQLISLG